MEAPKPPVLKISKEISGDKFIDNLEKINRDRVLNVAIEETSVHQENNEAVVDMDPKKMDRPKDVVFMDFMALYGRALKSEKK